MGVRRGRHARGLSLIFSRRHIVATSTPLRGHCLVQYCATNSMVRIDWSGLLCVCRLAISLTGSVALCLTLPWIVCIVRSVTHYYGIHTMNDKTLAVLTALKTIRLYCEEQDTEVMNLIDELSDANDRADNHFIERLYAHHHIWGKVGTKVGNMINDTLFDALDLVNQPTARDEMGETMEELADMGELD